ncbi:hypothetical protein DNH61_12065 [Paenibacillus sambharensis]|uniref:HAMP domain-containing protein n=1 Tax=Paenibacillus sambharensis TaxID=1803190 RepID=A0A2W1LJU9_9BACL|nr:sensor histidine kinase [Paenibacillus sambharensis]PZD95282.1 hypothetical protein DNH61_12065 [Paenibacillus sambharensis]
MKWRPKITLSIKFSFVLFILLGIVFLLNSNSYRVSVRVIEKDVQASYQDQLHFFLSQLENQVDQLAAAVLELEEDPAMKQYVNSTLPEDLFDRNKLKLSILEKIKLQSASSNWPLDISVYVNKQKEVISTRSDIVYDEQQEEYAAGKGEGLWSYEASGKDGGGAFTMVRSGQGYTIRAQFSAANIKGMLTKFQQDSLRHTMLLHPDNGVIGEAVPLFNSWLQAPDREPLYKPSSEILELSGQRVLVNTSPVANLGWVIVDLIPLDEVVLPVKESRQFFVLGIAAMLILGLVISALIYRQVQYPINELIVKLRDIRSGKYSSRLVTRRKDEFEHVYSGFNSMAERLQELIEKIYEEKLRAKEAELKQLQSQINPHFLYNCLYYIKNMAKLGGEDEVIAMSVNLGEYYRYITRIENPMATVREEVKLLRSYLNIQTMRSARMTYEVDIEESLMDQQIPRLLIQPLVENAIIHGIEKSEEGGRIVIRGENIPGGFLISVDNSGEGFQHDEGLDELRLRVNQPLSSDTGYGLWNINQRVTRIYEPGSGLEFEPSSLGGLKVSIRCIVKQQEGS